MAEVRVEARNMPNQSVNENEKKRVKDNQDNQSRSQFGDHVLRHMNVGLLI